MSSRNSKYEARVPAWVWLFTGAVAGAFVMFLFHLADVKSSIPQEKGEEKKTVIPNFTFDFYDKLQDSLDTSTPKETPQLEAAPISATYLVQVASFRSEANAEQLRARLIMMGLTNAYKREITLSTGDKGFQVLVGPLLNDGQVQQVKNKLQENKLDALVLSTPNQP